MHEVPAGARIAVRTDEAVDSAVGAESRTFAGEVTKDAPDTAGDVAIPRGSRTEIGIKSASKGGRFRGASDLVLGLKSVTIGRQRHSIRTAEIPERGKERVGASKCTAEFAGGGAVAGGGEGAALGALSGAGAGAVAQTVLALSLDRPLYITAER
jgi:hypothetical protein